MQLINTKRKWTIVALSASLCWILGGFFDLALANSFPGRGLPGRREGAGTRSECFIGESQPALLMPLIPESQLGITLAEYPTFFWHVPRSRAASAKFTLFSNYQGKKLYEANLPVTNLTGIASFTLPQNGSTSPLKVGLTYYWTLTLTCPKLNRPSTETEILTIQGFVQRIQPSAELTAKLKKASPRELPAIFASHQIWHETLVSLTKLRQENPKDASIQADWESLMKSIKLDQFASSPLLPCCQAPSTRTISRP